MALKEQIKSVLRYYKMEPECPFEYGTKEHFFWHSEREFLENSTQNEDFYASWVKEAEKYALDNPKEQNPLTDPKTPEATKAVIIYTDAMLDKWMAQHSDWIYEY